MLNDYTWGTNCGKPKRTIGRCRQAGDWSILMSEFEDVVNSAVADQEAERKKESDAYQDKIDREINAARDCVQALVDGFASDKRFGEYFQPQGDPHAQTRGQRFEFIMAGKAIMLHL